MTNYNHLKTRFLDIQDIALKASFMAYDYFKKWQKLDVVQKTSVQDLVSQADKEVEDFIRTQIALKYPYDGLLGEEQGGNSLDNNIKWIIDPIDGTYAFLHGIPLWCLSIGLLYKNKPIFGIIIDPNHGETFTAFHKEGAFCNGKAIKVIQNDNLQSSSVAFGIDKGVRAQIAKKFILHSIEHKIHIARTYTCALNMAWVAGGRILAAFYPFVNSWDFCAGLVLIEEAGGKHNNPLQNKGLTKGNALLASAPLSYPTLASLTQIERLSAL